MRALEATVLRLGVSSLALLGVGCRRAPQAAAQPRDPGTVVTVYVMPSLVDRVMGPLQGFAARHHWALSIRTDSAARDEADLIIGDSGGALVRRVRAGAPAAAQARAMADTVLLSDALR